jgi:translation initiation factor IF-1
MHTLCKDCVTRPKCKKVCKPVAKVLAMDGQVMEMHYSDCIKVYPQNHETQMATMPQHMIDEMADGDQVQLTTDFIPETRTGVFVDRFFRKLPYAEIGAKYDKTPDQCQKIYHEAIQRVNELIRLIDLRKSGLTRVWNRKDMTDGQKWFMLSALFRYTKQEIADLYGVPAWKVISETTKVEKAWVKKFGELEA